MARQDCKTGEFYSGVVNVTGEAGRVVTVARVTPPDGRVTQPVANCVTA